MKKIILGIFLSLLLFSGTLAPNLISQNSFFSGTYIPYTGANSDVNLGLHNLTLGLITASTLESGMPDGTRNFSFTTTDTGDAASGGEVANIYGAYNKTTGSNGAYVVEGADLVARSYVSDEAGTFRGASIRTYTTPGNATMRTAVGADISARAGYAVGGGGDCITPESGTCFTGARIWMAPYFRSSNSVIATNINNFHGLWIYNEHPTIPVTNAIMINNAASGGFTNGVNMTSANMTNDLVLHNANIISNPSAGTIAIDSNLAMQKLGSQVIRYMTNTCPNTIVTGEVVVLDTAVATGSAVCTTETANNPLVVGVALNQALTGATVQLCVGGYAGDIVKVNGTTDIAVGDPLSTFTVEGISAKGAYATGGIFAIALEAYTGDDSNGVIKAWIL